MHLFSDVLKTDTPIFVNLKADTPVFNSPVSRHTCFQQCGKQTHPVLKAETLVFTHVESRHTLIFNSAESRVLKADTPIFESVDSRHTCF